MSDEILNADAPAPELEPARVDLTEVAPWLPTAKQSPNAAHKKPKRKPVTKETLYCVAMQAGLAVEAGRRLTTEAKAKDPYALDRLLSHYGSLANITNGAQAYAQLVLRPALDFGATQTQAIAEELAAPGPKKTLFDKTIYNRNKNAAVSVRPDLVATKRHTELKAKADEEFHAAAQLRVAVWGHVEDKEAIDQAIVNITRDGFSFYDGTQHVPLTWTQCDPRLITTQAFTEFREDELLTMTAGDVSAFGHGADKQMDVDTVEIARGSLRPLHPDHKFPYVEDPLVGVPKGIIPIGIDCKDSEDERIYSLVDRAFVTGMMIFGRAGMGKSEFLKWIIKGLADAGESIIFIDPHSTACQGLRSAAPRYFAPERMKDLIVIDLMNPDYKICINPLDVKSQSDVALAVSTVMALAATHLKIDASNTLTQRLLHSSLIALCEANLHITDPAAKLTLLHIPAFFEDADFRNDVMRFVTNTDVHKNYREDGPYDKLKPEEQSKQVEVLLRRWGDFDKNEHLRLMLAAGENRFDPAQLMAEGKIVLIDLCLQRGIPEDLGYFIAGLIPYYLYNNMKVFGYVDDEETGERIRGKGCCLIMDEAASISPLKDPLLEKIAAQSRKVGFRLVLCNQQPDQWGSREAFKKLSGNIGMLATFQIDSEQALWLLSGLNKSTASLDGLSIASLDRYELYMKATYVNANNQLSDSGPFALSALQMMKDYEKKYLPDGKLQPEQRAWVDARTAEIDRISQELVCLPSAVLEARLRPEFNPVYGISRFEMTKYSVRHMEALVKEAEEQGLDIGIPEVAPFKTAPTAEDIAQVAAVDAAVGDESEFLVPDMNAPPEKFVEWA